MTFALGFAPNVMKTTLDVLGGPALPCQYMVGIAPPDGMLGGGLLSPILGYALSIPGSIALSIMTEKITLPGKGFETANIIRHGKHMKMPIAQIHDSCKMSFICTNSMVERTFFDVWMQFIQGPRSHYMDYFDNYKSTIWIKPLKNSGADAKLLVPNGGATLDNPLVEVGNALSFYELQEAYPVRIGAQELSYGETQGYLTVDVEFNYTHIKCGLDKIFGDEINNPTDLTFGPKNQ